MSIYTNKVCSSFARVPNVRFGLDGLAMHVGAFARMLVRRQLSVRARMALAACVTVESTNYIKRQAKSADGPEQVDSADVLGTQLLLGFANGLRL